MEECLITMQEQYSFSTSTLLRKGKAHMPSAQYRLRLFDRVSVLGRCIHDAGVHHTSKEVVLDLIRLLLLRAMMVVPFIEQRQ